MRVVNRKMTEMRCMLDMIEGEDTIYITLSDADNIVTGAITRTDEMYSELLELFKRRTE